MVDEFTEQTPLKETLVKGQLFVYVNYRMYLLVCEVSRNCI